MLGEMRAAVEAPAALGAGEGLLLSVDLEVPREPRAPREGPPAPLAGERRLPGVDAAVAREL